MSDRQYAEHNQQGEPGGLTQVGTTTHMNEGPSIVCPIAELDYRFGTPFPWANLTSAILHYVPEPSQKDPATIFDRHDAVAPAEQIDERLIRDMTPAEHLQCVQSLIIKHQKTGNIDEVIRLRMRALAVIHLLHSSDHYLAIKGQIDLARSYLQKGLSAQALDHARKAWDFNYSSKSPEDNKLLPPAIQLTIGLCKLQQGKASDAKPHLDRARHLNNFLRGENHESIVPIYRALGVCHSALGDYANAVEYLNKAQEMKRSLHGDDYDEVAEIYLEIADVYILEQRLTEIEDLYLKALRIYEALNGAMCREVAQISYALGRLMVSQSDYTRAASCFTTTAQWMEDQLGSFDPKTFNTWREVAFMDIKQQDYESAVQIMKKVLIKELLLYGDPSIKVAKTYKFLGTAYLKLFRLDAAISMYESAQRIYLDRYSARHEKTVALQNRVALLRKRLHQT
eukprot:gnl/Spiro4/5241_TR2647_c0_g1_i1.p1 gnl/Spiro4/5241_TR2647_c0_g1~~gnl/Spiro4/5241_TR2647_c0_g1_i1.p1  ORF type:complete len:470 (-),score=132.56 gnl/Spiro4/5241_TR2647_c0_g1_i1:153-1514(-)